MFALVMQEKLINETRDQKLPSEMIGTCCNLAAHYASLTRSWSRRQ